MMVNINHVPVMVTVLKCRKIQSIEAFKNEVYFWPNLTMFYENGCHTQQFNIKLLDAPLEIYLR